MLNDLKKGWDRFDIILGGVLKTPQRHELSLYGPTYMEERKVAVMRAKDASNPENHTLKGLNQLRLLVNQGGTNESTVDANGLKPITRLDTNRDVYNKILANEADVMITDTTEADFVEKMTDGQLKAVPIDDLVQNSAEYTFLLSPQKPGLAKRISSVLTDMLNDKTFKRVKDHIFSSRDYWKDLKMLPNMSGEPSESSKAETKASKDISFSAVA